MRLWKKVSAMVAMAAMCMTMAVPVTASAAEVEARVGGCPGGCEWEYDEREEVTTQPTKCPNCDDECKCTVTIVKIITFKKCNDCGTMVTVSSKETSYETHSCGCEDCEN